MQSKIWTLSVVITPIMIFFSIALFNYFVNPYGVFDHDKYDEKFVKNHSINSEMTKFYYAKVLDPQVLMIGTSRVEHINPEYLKKYTTGTIYNLAVKGSNIYIQHNLIKYFIGHHNIKVIYLGLDFFSFSPYYTDTKIENTRYVDYYLNDYLDSLLSFRTFRKSIKTYKDVLKDKQANINLFNGWESYSKKYFSINKHKPEWLKQKIESSFPNYKVNERFFNYEEFKKPESIDKAFDKLESIMSICKKNNVSLKIFTTPIYHKVYDIISDRGYGDTYKYWKSRLKRYSSIYDFSYKNSITYDFSNYVEATHFRSSIGELIFARMNKDYIDKLPDDFGRLMIDSSK
jgi:hypothetical protein